MGNISSLNKYIVLVTRTEKEQINIWKKISYHTMLRFKKNLN